jgi:hypothetical protein
VELLLDRLGENGMDVVIEASKPGTLEAVVADAGN